MKRRTLLSMSVLLVPAVAACAAAAEPTAKKGAPVVKREIEKTMEQWKKELSPEAYHVLFEKGTERAFSGKYWNEHRDGVYNCAACATPLFSSADKFESGTGWPSYTRALNEQATEIIKDVSYGMVREEVVCRRCGGHLGHVFDDGPKPTGKRYCMNSVSMAFVPKP
ncbi:MAG: peptide-methionine (R)-S-oxide reductase MsrB [Deltaproteobacteria bacterium]|nr:peptide-methionine (R)-S-oxide reductase MsrB [Deltaproteobacteria bacterium]